MDSLLKCVGDDADDTDTQIDAVLEYPDLLSDADSRRKHGPCIRARWDTFGKRRKTRDKVDEWDHMLKREVDRVAATPRRNG